MLNQWLTSHDSESMTLNSKRVKMTLSLISLVLLNRFESNHFWQVPSDETNWLNQNQNHAKRRYTRIRACWEIAWLCLTLHQIHCCWGAVASYGIVTLFKTLSIVDTPSMLFENFCHQGVVELLCSGVHHSPLDRFSNLLPNSVYWHGSTTQQKSTSVDVSRDFGCEVTDRRFIPARLAILTKLWIL